MRRICFVTCRTWPRISESDRLVQQALEARGATVEARAWNAPGAEWNGFEAIVLRSNWDYHFDPHAFLAWLERLERAGARIWNPPALVRWNLSKAYLLELARAGVPTVATVVRGDETRAGLEALMAARGWTRVVMKPVISASAHDTRLVSAATMDDAVGALRSGAIRRPVLVQPFVEEIQTRGEWSLVFIDAMMTHAVLKRPASGEFRVQPHLGGTVETLVPPDAVGAVARAALAALPVPPLYARIDGVETAAGFQIMEVEVNEPGLFFPHAPAAALRFADALLRRASSTPCDVPGF
jgi:glutathione synthase/RimK-type ligase-like ATP-grasp enzyme